MHPIPMTSCQSAAVRHPAGLLPLRSGRSRQSLTIAVANNKPAPSSSSSSSVRCHCASSRRDDDAEEFSCNNTNNNAGGGGWSSSVDEGMAVLRRRIHEMEAAERGWDEPQPQPPPPEEWAAWEEEWYATRYGADVCSLLGLLQAFLLGSRPAVGVGLVAALALAVPASAFALVSFLLDASRAVVSGLHHHH